MTTFPTRPGEHWPQVSTLEDGDGHVARCTIRCVCGAFTMTANNPDTELEAVQQEFDGHIEFAALEHPENYLTHAPPPPLDGSPYECGVYGCRHRAAYEDMLTHLDSRHPIIIKPQPPERLCSAPGVHSSTSLTEGDYERCGDCGGRLADNDPRRPHPDLAVIDRNIDEALAGGPTPAAPGMPSLIPPGGEDMAVSTAMTPEQFSQWIASEGDIFVVYLPGRRSYVTKVPALHYEFFVAQLQQIKFNLGPEVQAVRMLAQTGAPAEVEQPADPTGYEQFVAEERHALRTITAAGTPPTWVATCTCGHTEETTLGEEVAEASHNRHARNERGRV